MLGDLFPKEQREKREIGGKRETLRVCKSHLMEVVTGQVDSVGKEMGVFTDCFTRKLGCRVPGRSPQPVGVLLV